MTVRLRHDSHQPVVGFPSAVAILPLCLDRTNETCTDYVKLIPQGSMLDRRTVPHSGSWR